MPENSDNDKSSKMSELLPRLTGFVRAHCASDMYNSTTDEYAADVVYKQKRKSLDITWQEIVQKVETATKGNKELSSALRELRTIATDIVGAEAGSEAIDGCAAYMYTLFSTVESVNANLLQRLKETFGFVDRNVAKRACEVVNIITGFLPECIIENFSKAKALSSSEQEKSKEFGAGYKFSQQTDYLLNTLCELKWLDSDSESEEEIDLDMRYNEHALQSNENEKKDGRWMRLQFQTYFGSGDTALGMSVNELCLTTLDTLKSSQTDSELQNYLFELLGFDRFELIQSLLENRKELQNATVSSQEPPLPIPEYRTFPRDRSSTQRPNYGCQVTIQSDKEKQLRKQMAKEEKRWAKAYAKQGGNGEDDAGSVEALGMSGAELRAIRESQLRAVAAAPLLKIGESEILRSQPKYPYVFDAYAEACQSSSFVAGTKIILPEGFERVNDKLAEEVSIPPSDPAPADIGRKLIPINTLDQIGKMAFSGMKSLNRIQSVVYEKAYKTNENLLICAPTGAGKTNIAMLTVVNTIKQHVIDGKINYNDFKIVYVAPMKALAAEMVRNFGRRLEGLNITVRELTGDMQLSKSEIMRTQMLVTTPEKWDVVTRKSTGDVALTQIVRLLIIDEVHLLHDDRGSVIESLVARTVRQVESSQKVIRIVGLSATLPNYIDVARFLNVSPTQGLFFFDGRFRPVPLAQKFIGVKASGRLQQLTDMNEVCYREVLKQVRAGEQVMVFVHARNDTFRTASALAEMAKNKGHITSFSSESSPKYGDALKQISRSRNRALRDLFADGFSIHHAGMLRPDRNLVERYFAEGLVKCLVCTATLAWGVNLPAHAVVIKGTQIYDAKRGSFVDLGILDVMQIFGRAGRPQFDTFGAGTIITTHDKLAHYLSLLTRQNPIESQFIASLTDNLNAEISLGTVTNVEEAVEWLSYTYLYVRMRANPLAYGVDYHLLNDDPFLIQHRRDLITNAARALDKAKMVRFDERTGYLNATDLGRTASHFYIKYDTVETFNELFQPLMTEDKILSMVSQAQEFEQIKVREEELLELDFHMQESCMMKVEGGSENSHGKTNILLQTYVSRAPVDNFSLVSDMAYVAQNASRIMSALFEMSLRRGWPLMAGRLLQLTKTLDKRMWSYENPLRQFSSLGHEILSKIEEKHMTIEDLKEMEPKEIGLMVRHVRMGTTIKHCVEQIPALEIEPTIRPITRTVLQVKLALTAQFHWNDKVHGKVGESFWIWVEDPENNHIYHYELFTMFKKHVVSKEPQSITFTIPIFEPLPSQYYIRAVSDRWMGSETMHPISFQHLILPERHPPHTELLDLQPLPVSALANPQLEALYSFTHFNPVQTQIFHTLYHTDANVLLGAPTGSGKTVAAELAIFRVFREYPNEKCVYIAPLKALVRERVQDWKVKIEEKLGKKIVELTGDVAPDMRSIGKADLIVTTPEKWDGISRSWQTRGYVKAVTLIVIDEIHLLGDDRGPVLEVIVSRTNFISSHTTRKVRVVGLSTALANARDLADWLGIQQMGLFNFRPSVRPVPLEVHISGFPGKHYCPRMATMNKPTYQAIQTHSPKKPALVFVSSRRQTRLTAMDLMMYLANDTNPKQWLHMPEDQMEQVISSVKESNLKLSLSFGIGLHHAGLNDSDKKTVEELYVNQKIQVLVATSTLAWGVNFPAHLVVVKGTEYFDGKLKRYVDFPITDVLQMMGRAGRPQFDDQGVAVILVHDVKKHYFKKFMYEPFPVESNLLEVLPEHLNAEIVAGTISSKQEAMDYLTWTYFFRRLLMNPSFYNLEKTEHDKINVFLSGLVEDAINKLHISSCLTVAEDNLSVSPTTLGRIASYYYIHYSTVRMFVEKMNQQCDQYALLKLLADAHEYSTLPVRHNEDTINLNLARELHSRVTSCPMDDSNTKAYLLLEAYFSRHALPSHDYDTDTKSVLDQAIRILQAMIDVSADQGWLATCIHVVTLMQMCIQAKWSTQHTLLTLPHVREAMLQRFIQRKIECLPQLVDRFHRKPLEIRRLLPVNMNNDHVKQITSVLALLPLLSVSARLRGFWGEIQKQKTLEVQLNTHYDVKQKDTQYITVNADEEYTLIVDITRRGGHKRRGSAAVAPRFPKPKDECWFLLLGEVDQKDLIALKRVPYVHKQSTQSLAFYTPEKPGRYVYTLYLMSDCYLGMDQQYDICLDVQPAFDPSQEL